MRNDMAKVIVERPRSGGGGRHFPLRGRPDSWQLDVEEWRPRQGMRRPWLGGNHKSLNENLAPLRRYLRSQVGRPWNKVYSEICEHMNRDSAVQLHIWQHLMQYVCTTPPQATGRGIFGRSRFAMFIVNPKTGLLQENPRAVGRYRREPPAPDPDRVKVRRDLEYRRLDGVWYELRLKPLPAHRLGYDFAIKGELGQIEDGAFKKFYGALVYAAQKRQLNKADIRRLKLNHELSAHAEICR